VKGDKRSDKLAGHCAEEEREREREKLRALS
jgi:hypothetical protein